MPWQTTRVFLLIRMLMIEFVRINHETQSDTDEALIDNA